MPCLQPGDHDKAQRGAAQVGAERADETGRIRPRQAGPGQQADDQQAAADGGRDDQAEGQRRRPLPAEVEEQHGEEGGKLGGIGVRPDQPVEQCMLLRRRAGADFAAEALDRDPEAEQEQQRAENGGAVKGDGMQGHGFFSQGIEAQRALRRYSR